MFIDNKYIVYIINKILPDNRLDCMNFIAIPMELLKDYKIDNLIDEFTEKMELDFNNYNYVLISHISRCTYTFYKNIKDIEYVYNITNNKIMFEYGENKILNICKKFYIDYIINII